MINSQEKRNKRLLFIEIVGDLTTAVFKFIFGIIGNSSVMIAEGFHSLADTANQVFLLVGVYSSKKIADRKHPFGYGKEKFFWAFISAIFILTVSAFSAAREGIDKIKNPQAVSSFGLSFLILGVALVFQLINLSFSLKYFHLLYGSIKIKKGFFHKLKFIKEPTIINLCFGDVVAIAGNLVAALALYLVKITGNAFYDGIASIIIGAMLALFAIFLIVDVKELLIGEAVSPVVYKKIISLISQTKEVESIVKLKTMHLSPTEILLNADLEFKDDLSTEEIEKAIDEIEENLKKEIIGLKQISIEAEPKQ
jgi:cation diffusion facilitator family transporter